LNFALINCSLFTGDKILKDHSIIVKKGIISDIIAENKLPQNIVKIDAQGGLLAPGFIDTQVNGGGGVMFNDEQTTEALQTIANAHRRYGTTALMPTLITDCNEKIGAADAAVSSAIKANTLGILGLHLEGPFISKNKKGVHSEQFIRTLTDIDICTLSALKTDLTIITLAPEACPTGAISALKKAGLIINAGHSAATLQTTNKALAEGLTGFTHLYNAMSPLTAREPGIVGAALIDEHSYCAIIVDTYHVEASSLQIALKCKPKGKVILVTDAMATVGAATDHFNLYGNTVYSKNGRCALADGTLAGSALNMAQAVKNCVEYLNLPLSEALKMASLYPAQYLGIAHTHGKLKKGYRADMVLLNDKIEPIATWISGQEERYH
jgi:N-acetylglucosamine-6-phosphate deacetylase